MARTNTNKEAAEKKRSVSHAKAKDKRSKSAKTNSERLQEQISLLGGGSGDADLLKGLNGDAPLEIDEQEHDPALVNDVSKFLEGLKSSKGDKPPTNDKKPKSKKGGKGAKENNFKSQPPEKSPSEIKDVKPPIPPTPLNSKVAKLVFPPGPQWYSAVPSLTPPSTSLSSPTSAQLSSFTERAANLIKRDAELYQSSAASTGQSSSDSHFLNTILAQGTLSDRLSALTLLVQGSPIHNMKALETLKGMSERGRGKGGREEGLKAMRCIIDWWVGGGAPNRKLRYMRDQPFLLHPDVTDQHLILWYFEDWLKKLFFSVLQILETYSLDPLPYVRTQTLSFITTLLRDKPEQEQNLLRLLVNKMGDTEKSVCSRASYHVLQVLQTHPAMKAVIVREIRALVFRPTASTSASIQEAANKAKSGTHIRFEEEDEKPKTANKKAENKALAMERWNSHSWYYSSVTLNQVVLTASDHDRETAKLLIEVYFEMFREILGSLPENAEDGPKDIEEQREKGDDLKKGLGKKGGKGKEKAVQGAAGFAEVEDSNSRLVSAILTGVNRALPFAKVDIGDGNSVFKKHIDTLFLITHTSTFNISLQALMLILQVITTLGTSASPASKSEGSSFSASLADRYYRTLYSSLLDPRLSKSNKQAMYLNLLFKSIKVDKNLDRAKAFVRRFVQVLVAGVGGSGGPEFIAGGLYLLGELLSTVPGLRDMLKASPASSVDDAEAYDPRKRDPQYAHASASPLFELLPLTNHYHPSVSLHAHQLLSSAPLTASADLSLNTLSHFLDRFVYKNPKKPKAKGASAMQPAASAADGASGVKLVKGEAVSGGPVNEETWWKRRVEDIPADEVFFHTYFQKRHEEERRKKAKVGKRKGQNGSDSEEVLDEDDEDDEEEVGAEVRSDVSDEDSDKEETEIWKAMKATMPIELQGDELMDDSDDEDDIPEMSDDESGAELGSDGNEEIDGDSEDDEEQDADNDNDDALSLAEGSDAEDLLSLDADIPDGLIEYDGSDGEGEEAADAEKEWTGFGGNLSPSKKRKRDAEDKGKRKKLRSLPTFASYEDYAKLIEDGPEDNI